MGAVALSGNDTIIINGRIFADFGDGDVAMLEFPNEGMTVTTGKNGNSLYAFNSSGQQVNVTLKLLKGTGDDKFLNDLLASNFADPAAFVLMTGSFIKRMGTGTGETFNDTYILSGGVFTKGVDVKTNVSGDTEEVISTYLMAFPRSPRVIG